MEASVYQIHHTSLQAPQFIANVAVPGRSPIAPECIIHAIQGLALSLGFINYPTSGSAAIHIYHINSDQKCLVSINATDLLLQIGCLQNLEQEEVAVLHENFEIP